ncbi:MAG TPA: hypothetical protein VJ727_03805 [Rhodanobacteraceae bacterium]|nr:hypothetical protein [Rhodanobacteraceae bacterium]
MIIDLVVVAILIAIRAFIQLLVPPKSRILAVLMFYALVFGVLGLYFTHDLWMPAIHG